MLQTILKIYSMAMATGTTNVVPHLVGPPGCGKSTVVQQVADLADVNLHIINVSRISPLDLEGVQMPVDLETKDRRLELLLATYWNKLQPGDIVLLDEFLRGFPEVYNGLLDIITSRQVAGFKLPKVVFLAASNSVTTYDKALEDRLLHLPVPDPRKNSVIRKGIAQRLVDELGLMPEIASSMEMKTLIKEVILPTYEIIDRFTALRGSAVNAPAAVKGMSLRHLIGQAKLRQVICPELLDVLVMNNARAMNEDKPQYLFLFTGQNTSDKVKAQLERLRSVAIDKLTPVQKENLDINLQLIEMEQILTQRGVSSDQSDNDSDDAFDTV